MASGIYEIVNTVNGKRYVGSAVNLERRKKSHLNQLRKGNHDNVYLQRAWNKYGANAFEFLAVVECPSGDLIAREQERINNYTFESLYNLSPTAGSSLGTKYSDEARAKISEIAKNRSPETRAKNSASNMGRPKSVETRAKMSEAAKGNKNLLGHVPNDETRAKMSKALKDNKRSLGYVHSVETRAKMSEAAKGNKNFLGHVHSAEARAKMSEAAKKRKAAKRSGGRN